MPAKRKLSAASSCMIDFLSQPEKERKERAGLSMLYQAVYGVAAPELYLLKQMATDVLMPRLPEQYSRFFQYVKVLGHGRSGVTLLIQHCTQPQHYLAVKWILCRKQDGQNEFKMAKRFARLHIGVDTFASAAAPDIHMRAIVQEAAQMSLADFLKCIMSHYREDEKAIYKTCLTTINTAIMNILNVMYQHKLTHGDMHIYNIMVTGWEDRNVVRPKLRLIDFGESSHKVYNPEIDIFQLFRTMMLEYESFSSEKKLVIHLWGLWVKDMVRFVTDWAHEKGLVIHLPINGNLAWVGPKSVKNLLQEYRQQDRESYESPPSIYSSTSIDIG